MMSIIKFTKDKLRRLELGNQSTKLFLSFSFHLSIRMLLWNNEVMNHTKSCDELNNLMDWF